MRRGLLFAGTESTVYVSFDDGQQWQPLQLNLPVVPIHDLAMKESDLIAATHGRAFWVLDDMTPLRQMSEQVQQDTAHLFEPRPTIRFRPLGGFSQVPESGKYYRQSGVTTLSAIREEKPTGEKVDRNLTAGQNPPDGVTVYYYLKEQPEGEVKLAFQDKSGKEIKSFSSEEPPVEAKNVGKKNEKQAAARPEASRPKPLSLGDALS